MKKLLFFLLGTISFIFSCNQVSIKNNLDDKTIEAYATTEKKVQIVYYLDSMQIKHFFEKYPQAIGAQEKLQSFYKKRSYAFAWIGSEGFNEHTGNFINLLNQKEIKNKSDGIFYLPKLHSLYSKISDEMYKFYAKDSLETEMELLLTLGFFDYAQRNWASASSEELKKVSWFIEPKNINYANLLDTILKSGSNSLAAFEPVYRQYELLKKWLQKYNSIEKNGGWAAMSYYNIEVKSGDHSPLVSSLKKQLYAMEDLSNNDTTELFDEAFTAALKIFQNRHGLKEDGLLNKKTIQEMNVSVHERIQQIMINMERSRWVPVEMKGDYLVVNIPEFTLHVYHNDSLEWSCNAVVGKTKQVNNTVIFNDNLEYIVFSPYWNIPKNILTKETLPSIKKNPNYLSNHNMEVVDSKGNYIDPNSINWEKYSNNFPYIIREKPGKNNSLGQVKFLFPNSYDIYLHDTPDKSLFNETTRTFSHGCIRIKEPAKLAAFLLRNDSIYTDEKIKDLMNGGKETYVKLKTKVPVFIAYFTAWVDRNGKLNFRDDVYNHDEKMKQMLFANE